MNFKTMETDTLSRILKQVSDELKNRECKDQAVYFQAKLSSIVAGLNNVSQELEKMPKVIKYTPALKVQLDDLTIVIEDFFKAITKDAING